MAEPVMDMDQEDSLADNQQEIEGNAENKLADNQQEIQEGNAETDASVVAGLNLVLMLSFYSLSSEECPNLDDINEMETAVYEQKAKHGESRSSLQTRKRQVNQFAAAAAKQSSKFNTKIRDSRHCRRF